VISTLKALAANASQGRCQIARCVIEELAWESTGLSPGGRLAHRDTRRCLYDAVEAATASPGAAMTAHDLVGTSQQAVQGGDAFSGVEIHERASLAEQAVSDHSGLHVWTVGGIESQHLGTQGSEEPSTDRARDHSREIQDTHPGLGQISRRTRSR
jgi:hypothetical protein